MKTFDNTKFNKITFAFLILFVVSLTNSIFVNQVGYYVALLLLIYRYYANKENVFYKNGLEIILLLFLIAEIISAIFSQNHSNAFNNVLKRLLLLPIIYVIPAVVTDKKKLKIVIYALFIAAFLTIFIYLGISIKYYLQKLYSTEAKGPSLFKYVMTAGGLISFITILIFAFVVNEKTTLKNRILYFILFIIALLALLGNYSRAAWLGTFIGLITVLILKRKWVLLGVPLVLIIAYLFIQPNKSQVNFYKVNNNSVKFQKSIKTLGQAKSVLALGNSVAVADFNKGIFVLKNDKVIQNINTELPVVKLVKWQDSVVAAYVSYSRFLLYKVNADTLSLFDTLTTNGTIVNIISNNNKLYIAQNDSGLIVKNNPFNLADEYYFKDYNDFIIFATNNNYFSYFSPHSSKLVIYKSNLGVPNKLINEISFNTTISYVYLKDSLLLFQSDNGLHIYNLVDDKANEIVYFKEIKGILSFIQFGKDLLGVTNTGMVYNFKFNDEINYKLFNEKVNPITYYDEGITLMNNMLIITNLKRNRVLSIFDPNHNTNIQRLDQWKTGLRIFKDYPIFGVGDIDLKQIYLKYKAPYEREAFGHLHNNYVHLLVILGIFGFIVVLILFYKVAKINIVGYIKTKNIPFVSSVTLGAAGAFIGFLFSGLAEWNFGDHEIITFVWFLTGLNIACGKLIQNEDGSINEK